MMTEIEKAVLEVISSHRGREEGIRGRDLAQELNLRHRLVRECVESLVTIHGVPIGSDPLNGYYLIATEDEYRKARHELTARIIALGNRIRALEAAFRRGRGPPGSARPLSSPTSPADRA